VKPIIGVILAKNEDLHIAHVIIKVWREKVKHGGWIGGHDYDNLPRHPGVKKAVVEAFPDGVELGADHVWFKRMF
jgi:hypothetical protein